MWFRARVPRTGSGGWLGPSTVRGVPPRLFEQGRHAARQLSGCGRVIAIVTGGSVRCSAWERAPADH
jgi:hypothetical protein